MKTMVINKNNKCIKCGKCCMDSPLVCLTYQESKSGKYKFFISADGRFCLKRKKVYLPRINKKILVCIYFDNNTKKCKIYNDRPLTCKLYKCEDI